MRQNNGRMRVQPVSSRPLGKRVVAPLLRTCRGLLSAKEEETGRDTGRCPVKGFHLVP